MYPSADGRMVVINLHCGEASANFIIAVLGDYTFVLEVHQNANNSPD